MFQFEKTYKEWTWERISRHIIYWLVWLFFYSIVGSSYSDVTFLDWVQLELSMMAVKLPFTYFVVYYLVPNYLIPKKYLQFFSSLLFFATIGGLLIWSLYFFIYDQHYFRYQNNGFWSFKISFKSLDLIYIASLPVILKMLQRHSFQENQTRLLAEQKLGAELKILKNQLHPHFLFNTLNNLYSMVLTQHPKAAEVVVRLSDMMSYMLYECERPLVDLNKEINNLKNYISLEKIRYGKRLDLSFETAGDVAGKSIAPLLLLPFFENAFKHGVEKSELVSWVRINLWVNKDKLIFMIENSVPEAAEVELVPKSQSGVGLSNVKKRLELLYPDAHDLEIKHNGDTYLTKLKFNLSHEMPHRR